MLEYIISKLIKQKAQTPQDLAKIKREGAFKFKQEFPTNIQLLKAYHDFVKKGKIKKNLQLEKILKTREIRTSSGVAIITVLTKPWPCPGHCLYCPSEYGMPKSYLKTEPAAQRAYMAKFDPYRQVRTRLEALQMTGHETDKIELIVLGGTWSAYPKDYQCWFIKECFKACNLSTDYRLPTTVRRKAPSLILREGWGELKKEQRKNETAAHRIVGLTLETRPDFINIDEIKQMRDLGCTRVELGVQSIYDDVLKKNRRGHNIADTIHATRLLKDAGFKINYHVMLGLPGSTVKRDEKMFNTLFSDERFQPDLLKIYPCVVLKTAPLYKLWQAGGYKPYSEKQLINLILRIKQKIPPYVRIQRIVRDIPGKSIIAGSKLTNLRQVIEDSGIKKCNCIRCREVRGAYSPKGKIKLFRREYAASDGKEIFLSFESADKKKLYALLRLRIPKKLLFEQANEVNASRTKELTASRLALRACSKNNNQNETLPVIRGAALIRELHTYGQLVPLTTDNRLLASLKLRRSGRTTAAQHKGLGKKLMSEAEKIVRHETNLKSIAVISGIGVRRYYKKLGYRLKDEYMIKNMKRGLNSQVRHFRCV